MNIYIQLVPLVTTAVLTVEGLYRWMSGTGPVNKKAIAMGLLKTAWLSGQLPGGVKEISNIPFDTDVAPVAEALIDNVVDLFNSQGIFTKDAK